jgi:1-acyl-sn-glycerol-3-phosphate acyltransferase
MAEQTAIATTLQKSKGRPYEHARHEPVRRVLRWIITNIAWRYWGKIDRVEGLENVPTSGPAILMINHIAFIDPIVVLGNAPRNVVPLAKVEAFRIPVWGLFVHLWNVIPVHRGEADREALMRALSVLEAGEIVLVAPEGTRHESLRDVKTGIAYLAYKSGAPVIPVAVEGTQGFPSISPKRWAQPGATVKFGNPFRVKPIAGRVPREALKTISDEAMYRLSVMLSPERRGEYSDLSKATTDYIVVNE